MDEHITGQSNTSLYPPEKIRQEFEDREGLIYELLRLLTRHPRSNNQQKSLFDARIESLEIALTENPGPGQQIQTQNQPARRESFFSRH